MIKLTKTYIKSFLKTRDKDAHKGNFGHALLIAGSSTKIGAAIISSKACLRSGIGLLTTNIPAEERLAMQVSIPEAMISFREDKINEFKTYQAIGIGPGIGTEKKEAQLMKKILQQSTCPLVLDADALNIISKNKTWLQLVPKHSILTLHPKEFDRLFGEHPSEKERRITALQKAKKYSIILVLKGHETFICSEKDSFINSTGNVGLAKGGSGDALTGIILAFLGQGYEPIRAAQLGVFLHGLAADNSIKQQSVESLLITDVIEHIGIAFQQIRKK